jgi:hypothetical protein
MRSIVLALLCLLTTALAAQTEPATAPAATATPVERERSIFVPYTELEQVFQDGGTGVFLPYREFLDLWNELTQKRQEKVEPPPANSVLSLADYTGRIEGQTLLLDAKLTAESFKTDGWTVLPISAKHLPGLSEAVLGKAVLRTNNDGSADLLLPDAGRYEITLRLAMPIRTINTTQSVQLALPRASVSKLVIIVPGEGHEFDVAPSAAITTRPLPGQTELSFFFGQQQKDIASVLSWGKPTAATTMAPLLLAETKITSSIHPGVIKTSADIDLRVLRSPMSSLQIDLPTGQEVLGVESPLLKSWDLIAAAQGRQTLTLSFSKPVQEALTINIKMEGSIATLPTQLPVPNLSIVGAQYARGVASVHSEPQFEVTAQTMDSATRISSQSQPVNELAHIGDYRLIKQPYSLTLQVQEAKPQVEVSHRTRLDILRDTTRMQATLDYTVRRVGLFETSVQLPADLQISKASSPDLTEWKIDSSVPTAPKLLLKFSKLQLGNFAVIIDGRILRKQATEDATLPILQPDSVNQHEGKLAIAVHSSLEANTKTLGDLQQEDVNTLNVAKTNNTPPLEPSLGFSYRNKAAPAVLSFKVRAPQVTAKIFTKIEAMEQATRHSWAIQFDIAYASIDRLIIAVPKAVANDIRLIDPTIKEINKAYTLPAELAAKLPNVADYTAWEITLRSEALGQLQWTLTHETQSQAEVGKIATLDLLQIHAPGIFQETGQLAIIKDNSLELRDPQAEGLEEIDVRELTTANTGAFQAYKYRALPFKFSIKVAKNDYHPVPQSIITHADLTTAVASDQAQSTEAIYWIKNIDQQFLVLTLPPRSQLVSDVHVDSETQQPMRREGSNDLHIRLPTGRNGAFAVRLVYQQESSTPGSNMPSWGSVPVAPPSILAVQVLETRHRLYLPDGHDYIHFAGPMAAPYRQRGWTRMWEMFRRALWWLPVDTMFGIVFAGEEKISATEWQTPPQVGQDVRKRYAFQVPTQGRQHTLYRLGAPATIDIHFRSRTLSFIWQALAFGLIVLGGLWGITWTAQRKASFLGAVLLLAMLVASIASPNNAPIAMGLIRGWSAVLGLWVLLILHRNWQAWRITRKPNGNSHGPSSGPRPITPAPKPSAPPADQPTVQQRPPIDHPLAGLLPPSSTTGSSTAGSSTSSGPTQVLNVPMSEDPSKPSAD